MQLNKNEIEILKFLIASSDFVSSYDIATATGINRRTVRDEMINVKSILKELGYHLISKTSKGYMIEGKSKNSLSELQKTIEYSEQQRESIFPTLPSERESYILKRLIETNDYMKMDDLAAELLISRSTISCDIKKIKKTLKKYDLILKQKPNYGLCITGDEANKRKVLCDYIFTNLNQSEMFYDYLDSYFTDKNSVEYGVIDIIKKYGVELSDYALCDFLVSLSVSINRILKHHYITKPQDLSIIKDCNEFHVASDIVTFLEEKLSIRLNTYEMNQIAIQLICKKSTRGTPSTKNAYTLSMVQEILDTIEEQTLLSFQNKKFKSTFNLYVENALIRIYYKEKIRNPFYNTMKNYTPLAYECALITSSVIERHVHHRLSSSELAFFAIIFHKYIYTEELRKKKTLLICGLGGGTGSMIKATILESFQSQIDIAKVLPYYQFYDEDLSQYDLIISTAPIHKKLSKPCIHISALINQEDINQIRNYLSYFFNQNQMKTYFHPQLFKGNMKMKNKTELINEFYKLLKEQYPSLKNSFKKSFVSQIQATYHEKRACILKLSKPLNQNNVLVVFILNKPLAINKEEKDIFILFSCLDSDNYIYNTLSNALSHLMNHPDDYQLLLKDQTYHNFLKMITKYQ